MDRDTLISRIESSIGHRRLMWVGTRGTDAHPLLAIDQFEGIVGLIAPLGIPSWPDGSEEYLERISGLRVDLNAYSVDTDASAHCVALGDHLRDAMTPGTVVVAYRPSAFLASAYYPRKEYATYLGMFHGHQAAFEHKPWVESELKARGVPIIPQNYFSDSDRGVMGEYLESLVADGKTYVMRANYSDGGAGLVVGGGDGTSPPVLAHDGGFLAVSPFLDPSVPLNVSACVYPTGEVTVKSPSIQLIGIPTCTGRRFGYCGNDFASVYGVLGDDGLDELEAVARTTGAWLSERGYVGAFGIDALLHDGHICLTEVNPRFQGCSAAAASILTDADAIDIYLDHLAAMLGLEAPEQEMPLREQAAVQAREGRRLTQVIGYNTGRARCMREGAVVPDLDYGDLKGTPEEGVVVAPEAMLFKMFVFDAVTSTGCDLPPWLSADIERLTGQLFEDHEVIAREDEEDA